jgi:hypothetical protein
MRHRHIVQINAVFVETTKTTMKAYVQMPEYQGGDLQQWLQAGEPNPHARRRLLFGLLQAVERVHAAGISHNDIKLSNVLLTEGAQDAILSDFEMSNSTESVVGATTTVVGGGTHAYMAPERARDASQKGTSASDMYSLGVVLLLAFMPGMIEPVEACTTTVPEALKSAASQMDVDFPGLRPLLQQLTAQRPQDRCTITDLLQHRIFRAMSVPVYWTAPSADEVTAVRLVAGADDVTLAALQAALVTKDPAELGKGADATQWPPNIAPANRCLKLAAAWRLQNHGLYRKFTAAVDQTFSDVSRGPDLASVSIRKELVNAVVRLPGQLNSVAINESFLISGVPAPTVLAVAQNGMNERFSGANAGTLFGEGSYFAEDAGKCDHYTGDVDCAYDLSGGRGMQPLHELLYPEGAEGHPGDVCYLLVCRVVLGYTLRTQHPCSHGPKGLGKAMDADATDDGSVFATRRHKELKTLKDSNPPLHHHSLLVELGGRIHRYREFVVFHGEQVYPECECLLATLSSAPC